MDKWEVQGQLQQHPAPLKSTSIQYPVLTCFISVMEIPLALPQIFSKVDYTCECPGEVVLWKLNTRVVVGMVGPEGDLESEVRRNISPSTSHRALAKTLDDLQPGNEV